MFVISDYILQLCVSLTTLANVKKSLETLHLKIISGSSTPVLLIREKIFVSLEESHRIVGIMMIVSIFAV